MKRKSLRVLVCALLASLALTTFAFADNGPKPQLIVRVKNAPQEPYYLDLLAKGDWDAEDGNRIDGIDWNYDGVVMQPAVTDVPGKSELVKGIYDIPEGSGTIKVKITDLLSESLEVEVR